MITLLNPNANVEVVKRLDISTPPLGLGYLAAVLRREGFKVRIIDDMVENLNFETLIKRVKNSIMVGITSTTPTFNSALKYARKIKEVLPDIFVVLGGVHVTFRPLDAAKNDFVDAVCVSEGEETIVEVAEKVEAGKTLEDVKGVVYRSENEIVDNGPRGFIRDLDSLPFPAYDLMPLERYSLFGERLEQFPMITSRGCPFACRYCSSSLFMGHRFRVRSAENVVDEIEWLVSDFNAKHIAFSDDTFTLSRRRVEAICDEIRRRGIDVEWSCSSRVDTTNEDMLKKMKEAGCSAIYFGVESASPRILDFYRKKIDSEKVRRAVTLARKYGIRVICSFIIGAPMERKEEMRATLKFALELDPDYAQFSVLTPYPGTEIFDEAERKGWILSRNFDDFTAGKPVLKNFFMSPQEISRFLKYCYLRFYLRPKFILREVKRGNFKVILGVIRKALKW
ncbi:MULTISPECIES: B12-binding domain-containing radical SAM protein [unclassified Archaeoglobus]|jgi:anaerobic magnesium-protoporphyrin IX monomethyl ester cyclase|uniref:B12-binding domain-containing radical SAM protein n=1 Tax=unclassified Archaeoglobus TaxID=2643606 RepID=UPI0025BAA048|nr:MULTISPECIES: radical SAM protein [unclassified Archaeoglobus]